MSSKRPRKSTKKTRKAAVVADDEDGGVVDVRAPDVNPVPVKRPFPYKTPDVPIPSLYDLELSRGKPVEVWAKEELTRMNESIRRDMITGVNSHFKYTVYKSAVPKAARCLVVKTLVEKWGCKWRANTVCPRADGYPHTLLDDPENWVWAMDSFDIYWDREDPAMRAEKPDE